MELPVYFVNGFLDSGKTSFINGILEDGFAHDKKTLLIRCEEGEIELSKQALYNVTVVDVDDLEDLNPQYFQILAKTHRPEQVIIEWNGMWPMVQFCNERLPQNWLVYQVMIFIDATTFEMYTRNMGQLMMEKIINADLIVFNRCDAENKAALRARNLRMVNRRAEIFLESDDEETEDYANDDTPAFDLSTGVVEIDNADYGVLYVDLMDHPQRYVGIELHLRLVMCHSKNFPGTYTPGRFAMVCCEDDIEFLGLLVKGDALADFQDHQWMDVVATVELTEHPAYQGQGPQLVVKSAVACEKPEDDVVTF